MDKHVGSSKCELTVKIMINDQTEVHKKKKVKAAPNMGGSGGQPAL